MYARLNQLNMTLSSVHRPICLCIWRMPAVCLSVYLHTGWKYDFQRLVVVLLACHLCCLLLCFMSFSFLFFIIFSLSQLFFSSSSSSFYFSLSYFLRALSLSRSPLHSLLFILVLLLFHLYSSSSLSTFASLCCVEISANVTNRPQLVATFCRSLILRHNSLHLSTWPPPSPTTGSFHNSLLPGAMIYRVNGPTMDFRLFFPFFVGDYSVFPSELSALFRRQRARATGAHRDTHTQRHTQRYTQRNTQRHTHS